MTGPTILLKEKFLNLQKEQKIILFIIFFSALCLFLILLISKSQKSALPGPTAYPSPFFQPNFAIIGQDSFSRNDLNYLSGLHLPEKQDSTLTSEETTRLEELALERSVVIQEARKKGLIDFDEEIFKPDKNWQEYNQIYEKAKEAIISQEEKISVAGIFLYFYNQFPPQMGVGAAKELTRKKMEGLKEKLVGGEITLKQAAQIIASDTSLSEIDPIYYANAYAEFNNRSKIGQIVGGITDHDNNLLWSLRVGQYSPLILGSETGNQEGPNEAYWAIFQVNSKTGTEKPYLEWLEEAKRKYAAQIN